MVSPLALLLSPVGRWLAAAGLALALLSGLYLKGRFDGHASCKADWAAAEERAAQAGRDARDAGERDAARGLPDGFDRDR
jgi:hypothetical protein